MYEALHAAGIAMRTGKYYPQPPAQIPPEVAERAVARYLAGASLKAVAAELGLKAGHVSRLVEERGVKRSRRETALLAAAEPGGTPRNEWPAELAAEVLDRYAAGESGAAIAATLELGPASVYRLLGECGVLRSHGEAARMRQGGPGSGGSGKASGSLPAGVVEQAVALYLAGDSPRLIGRSLGVPAARVYLALRERGVVRTRSEARIVAYARLRAARGEDVAVVELPADWEAVAVERYVAGASGPAVAKGLGLPVGRVYGVLRARGVLRPAAEARRLEEARRRAVKQREGEPPPVDGRVRAIPAGLAAVVVERYAAGESGEAIAKDLGLGQGRVYGLLRERGVLRTQSEASVLREDRRRQLGSTHCGGELGAG